MNEGDALLQAIVENPADDTPRLIYADWLEEQGDPAGRDRADFIRIQYALEDLPPYDPRRTLLEERQRNLLLKYRDDWLPEVVAEHSQHKEPFVERIDIEPAALVQGPLLEPVEELDLRWNGLDAACAWQLARINAPRLRRLLLNSNRLTDNAVAALRDWPGLRRLGQLHLHSNAITDGCGCKLRQEFRGILSH